MTRREGTGEAETIVGYQSPDAAPDAQKWPTVRDLGVLELAATHAVTVARTSAAKARSARTRADSASTAAEQQPESASLLKLARTAWSTVARQDKTASDTAEKAATAVAALKQAREAVGLRMPRPEDRRSLTDFGRLCDCIARELAELRTIEDEQPSDPKVGPEEAVVMRRHAWTRTVSGGLPERGRRR